jgi:hypothetical protein
MPYHFVAQLTPGKGPDPDAEVSEIIAKAGVDPERVERGRATFGTRMAGSDWKWGNPAYAIAFFRTAEGTIDGFVAEILNRHLEPPKEIPAIYEPWTKSIRGWWSLRNAVRFRKGVTLGDIPGRSSSSGTSALETFSKTCSFAYWQLEASPVPALCEED